MNRIEHYRRLRRDDPYLSAQTAWSVARSAARADVAGVGTWSDAEPVEIDGRDYLLTVEPDDWGSPWDGDCYGIVEDRGRTLWGHPDPVEWPSVPLPSGSDGTYPSSFVGELDTYYDPGPHWEPYAPKGMARGLVRGWLRDQLTQEGLMIRDSHEWVARLVDAEDETLFAVLGGIGLGRGMTWERSYLMDVAEELAGELEYEREDRATKIREDLYARTAHG